MEGIAAIAVVFILFTVLAQAATALLAHQSAQAVVTASAARLAIDPATVAAEEHRVGRELAVLVPGAGRVDVEIEVGPGVVIVEGHFEFIPPGPLFGEHTLGVTADAPIVVEP